MNKLAALFNLFRKGEAVSNPGIYKDVFNAGAIIGGLILGIINCADAWGYKLPFTVDVDAANRIGLGIATVVGFVIHNISSPRAGILPAKPAAEPVSGDPAPAGEEQQPVQALSETAIQEGFAALERDRGR